MKFVPRKHSTSPFTNPFFTSGEWCEVKICIFLEDLCLSVMCLYIKGGFPINIFPLHAFVPESVIFWHTCKYVSPKFVHLSVVHLMGSWCATCMTQSFIFLHLSLFSFAIFTASYLFGLCFTLVVHFWKGWECKLIRLNFFIACLCSQIYMELVDLV